MDPDSLPFCIHLAEFTRSSISGASIRFKPLIIGGIVINLIGFAGFIIDWHYHFLLLAAASVIAFIIPGILLNLKNKKDNV